MTFFKASWPPRCDHERKRPLNMPQIVLFAAIARKNHYPCPHLASRSTTIVNVGRLSTALDKSNPRAANPCPLTKRARGRSRRRGRGEGHPSIGDSAFTAASARLLWGIPRRIEWDGRMAWRTV